LRIGLQHACRDKALGLVTNYCNDLGYNHYKGKGLWHDDVSVIADLHDLIIDAEKNGYLYGSAEFTRFRHERGLPNDSILKRREYDINLNAARLRNDSEYSNETKLLTILARGPRYKSSYILDRVTFEIINPVFLSFLDDFQKTVVKPAEKVIQDPDLEFQLEQLELRASRRLPIDLRSELEALERPIQETVQKWKDVWSSKNEDRRNALAQCIDHYNKIQPTDPDNPYWSIPISSSAPTPWECFKLAVFSRTKKMKAVSWIAKGVVCQVKALSINGKHNLDQIQMVMKATRPKEWQRADPFDALPIADLDDSGFDTDLDESLFDGMS